MQGTQGQERSSEALDNCLTSLFYQCPGEEDLDTETHHGTGRKT